MLTYEKIWAACGCEDKQEHMVSLYRGFVKQGLPMLFLSDHKMFYGKGKCMRSVVLLFVKYLSVLNLGEMTSNDSDAVTCIIFRHDFW